MNKYLQNIIEEKDGFSFGEAWRYNEDSLVSLLPILRKTSQERGYKLFKETDKVEVIDSGLINKFNVTNNEDVPVFIRLGEIFTGKSQERIATRSYLILPGEKVAIDVRCVYASKGILQGSSSTCGGFASADMDSTLMGDNFKMRSTSQAKVWKDVSMNATNLSASIQSLKAEGLDSLEAETTFSDNLKGNLDSFSKSIEKILSKVPHFEDQVGAAMISVEGVTGIELFDSPMSWKALRDDIIKRDGEHISKEQKDSPFEFKKEKAVDYVKKVLSLEFEEKIIAKNKDYKLIALSKDNYVGEILEYRDKLLHLTIIKK